MKTGLTNLKERYTVPLILIFAAIILTGTSYLFYNITTSEIKEEKYRELAAVSLLKEKQIQSWLRERNSDGFFFYSNPSFRKLAERIVYSAGKEDIRELEGWLFPLYRNQTYKSISLYNNYGKRLFTLGEGAPELISGNKLSEILKADTVWLGGLYRFNDSVIMDLISPLLDINGKRIATLIFKIDPYINFYPMIQSWPTPSRSAETALLKAEGDSIVYLNDLRHRRNTAITMTLPSGTNVISVKLMREKSESVQEGFDYRGVQVLAHFISIKGTDWGLISKIDRDEIFQDIDSAALLISGIAGFLFLTILLAIYLITKKHHYQQLATLYSSEKEKMEAIKKYESLTQHANDAILLTDMEGNIVEANISAGQLFDYPVDELKKMNLRKLRTSESATLLEQHFEQAKKEKGIRAEVEYIKKNGEVLIGEVSSKTLLLGISEYYLSIIRDVTSLKANQRALAKLSSFYRLMNEINEIVIRNKDTEGLLQKACKASVEIAGFSLSFVVSFPSKDKCLVRASYDSFPNNNGAEISEKIREDLCTLGVFREAVKNGHFISNNFNFIDKYLSGDYSGGDFISSIAAYKLILPTGEDALIVFCSRESNHFRDDELKLLSRLCSDLNYAMEAIEISRKKAEAEEKINEINMRLQALFNSGEFYMGVIELRDDDAYYQMCNNAFAALFNISPSEISGKSIRLTVKDDDEYNSWLNLLKECNQSGRFLSVDTPYRAVGDGVHFHWTIAPVDYPSKYPLISFIAFDISNRIKFEQELLESRESLRLLTNHLQNAREEERLSIARELHDELGQILTAVKMNITFLIKQMPKLSKEEIYSEVMEMEKFADKSVKSVRKLIKELRPEVLDSLGLVAAIHRLIEDFRERSGIDVNFDYPPDDSPFKPDVSLALFRIVQESFSNIAKYSEAAKVFIEMRKDRAFLHLLISDDGKGFDVKGKPEGFGLLGMKERVSMLGGKLEIISQPLKGTKIVVKIPYET